jgi:tryptophan halogenase
MLGQGIMPRRHSPLADGLPQAQLDEFLANIRTLIDRAVAGMPGHADFIARHFKAGDWPVVGEGRRAETQ